MLGGNSLNRFLNHRKTADCSCSTAAAATRSKDQIGLSSDKAASFEFNCSIFSCGAISGQNGTGDRNRMKPDKWQPDERWMNDKRIGKNGTVRKWYQKNKVSFPDSSWMNDFLPKIIDIPSRVGCIGQSLRRHPKNIGKQQ